MKNKFLLFERLIFALTIFIIPSLILKIGGWVTWSWWIVFLPWLIPIGWMLINIVVAAFLGGMDALKDNRDRWDRR